MIGTVLLVLGFLIFTFSYYNFNLKPYQIMIGFLISILLCIFGVYFINIDLTIETLKELQW